MKISIIVPMYNAVKTISKLIKSVDIQTYTDYEVILVDDGSNDNTYEYTKKLVLNNKKFLIYRKKNEGPNTARKYGFEKCTGDLIFFIDSDDQIADKSVLNEINDIFEKNNIDVLFFDREEYIAGKKETIKGFNNLKSGIHTFDEIGNVIRPGLGSKIFKRSKLSTNMFLNTNMYEDLYTTYVYLNNCNNFYYINKCYYIIHHDIESTSITSKTTEDMLIQAIKIILDLDKMLKNDSLKKTVENRIYYLFSIYLKEKKNYSKKIDSIMNDAIKLAYENKIKYHPEYDSTKRVLLKKIRLEFMLYYYYKKSVQRSH